MIKKTSNAQITTNFKQQLHKKELEVVGELVHNAFKDSLSAQACPSDIAKIKASCDIGISSLETLKLNIEVEKSLSLFNTLKAVLSIPSLGLTPFRHVNIDAINIHINNVLDTYFNSTLRHMVVAGNPPQNLYEVLSKTPTN